MSPFKKAFLFFAAAASMASCSNFDRAKDETGKTLDNVRVVPEAGVIIKNYTDGYKIVVDYKEEKLSKVFIESAYSDHLAASDGATAVSEVIDFKDIKDSSLAREIRTLRPLLGNALKQ